MRFVRFAPELGLANRRLDRIGRLLASDPVAGRHVAEEWLEAAAADGGKGLDSRVDLQYALALSLLIDVAAAGGIVHRRDSETWLAWPDWNGPDGRDHARKALNRLVDRRPLTDYDRHMGSLCFADDLTRDQLIEFLATADLELVSADEAHPSGIRYKDVFNLALRYWNMPYRGREGRLRRFLLMGRSPVVGNLPVVVGIFEIADDAPYSSVRDHFLTLEAEALERWLATLPDPQEAGKDIARLFRDLRGALLSTGSDWEGLDAATVVARGADLQMQAKGRDRGGIGLEAKKRLTYLHRLASGELAFSGTLSGEQRSKVLRRGVRAIHDLMAPRVHMDVAVCGALPPFASGLAGKLVVAYLSHPDVRRITATAPGRIAQSIFDGERLHELLPSDGILALTTRGLYPKHSSLYNRSGVAGADGLVVLRHLGDTVGTTTSLIGPRTSYLAQLLHDRHLVGGRVERIYGAGGAKRQRTLERSIQSLGLPEDLVHAGIQRPVYGVQLVENLPEVLWRRQAPKWLLPPATEAYNDAAASQWRARWMGSVSRRLAGAGTIPGTLSALDTVIEASKAPLALQLPTMVDLTTA